MSNTNPYNTPNQGQNVPVATLDLPDLPAMTTINEVVSSVRMRLGDRTQQKIKIYEQYALECLMEMNFSNPLNVKTWKILMDKPSRSISYPPDLVSINKVGIEINGHVWTLGVDESIAIPTSQKCGIPIRDICNNNYDPSQVSLDQIGFVGYWDNYGGWSDGFYGLGGGFNIAYYRKDEKKRMLWFDGDVPCNPIYIEGLTTGITMCGETVIERIMVAPIRDYVLFQLELNSPKVTNYMVEKREQQMNESLSKWEWRTFAKSFSLQDFSDKMHEVSSLGIHR